MRSIFTRGIFSLAILFGAAFSSYSQEPFKSSLKWNADDVKMIVRNDSVIVSLSVSLPNDGVANRKAVVLQPCLECGDNQLLLQPLSVYRMDQRGNRSKVRSTTKFASGSSEEVAVVSGTVDKPVELVSQFVRQAWMDSCEVKILPMEWSWKDRCNLGQWTRIATFVRPERPAFHPVYKIEEPKDSQSIRRVIVPLYLEYPSGGVAVNESFHDNKQKLEECVSSLVNLIGDSHVSVSGIKIRGWMSPEGSVSSNNSLCQRRLTPLVTYLRKKDAFCGKKVNVVCEGEDWLGMSEWIDGTYWRNDSTLNAILNGNSSRDAMEKSIRQSCPQLWEELMERCFPTLRRFEIVVSFTTCDMNSLESVWRAYKTDMRILSPHDFWYVSGRFPMFSEEWLDIVMDGADTYPDDETLNLNAACGLMKIGRFDRAVEYLRRFPSSERGRVLNAVWLMATERYSAGYGMFEGIKSRDADVQKMMSEARRIYDWMQVILPWEKY